MFVKFTLNVADHGRLNAIVLSKYLPSMNGLGEWLTRTKVIIVFDSSFIKINFCFHHSLLWSTNRTGLKTDICCTSFADSGLTITGNQNSRYFKKLSKAQVKRGGISQLQIVWNVSCGITPSKSPHLSAKEGQLLHSTTSGRLLFS